MTPSIFRVVVGTAGHIDHGKSALVEALTGTHPDRLPEEKARGLTIDLGFASFPLSSGERVGVVDVPGHERFVKNMVAGATGVDVVLLAVACDDGIMPQTREHLQILTLLGLRRGVVALTKADLADPDMRELVREDVAGLTRGTFLEGAPTVPVSVVTGEGLGDLRGALERAIRESPPRAVSGPFRMPIQRVFSAKGFGTVVTGIPVSGRVRAGDEVEILPAGLRGRIRGLQAYHADVTEVRAGHSSALNLADVDAGLVRRGFVAAAPGLFRASEILDARFIHLRDAGKPLRHLAPIRLHVGTEEAVGRIALPGRKSLDPGEGAFVQFRLESPVAAGVGDPYIVRRQSPLVTLGGGRILGSSAARPGRRVGDWTARLERTERGLGDPAALAEEAVRQAGTSTLALPAMAAFAGLDLAGAAKAADALVRSGAAIRTGAAGMLIHWEPLAVAAAGISSGLESFHRDNPLRIGADPAPFRTSSGLSADVFETAVDSLVKAGRLVREGGLLRLASFRPAGGSQASGRLDAVEGALRDGRFATPRREELVESLKIPRAELDSLIRLLRDQKKIVILGDDVLLHAAAVEEARGILGEILRDRGEVEASAFRDRLGTTRKYVIPLLEHFDKIGFTVREGNRRILKI